MSRFERWSRRKRGVEASDDVERKDDFPARPDVPPQHAGMTENPSDAGETPAPESVVAEGDLDAQLPDPDTLTPDSDFKPFLLHGVSPELKRRALRRMFSAGSYNVRDGLDDYDHDFSKARKLSSEVTAQLRRWMDTLDEDDATGEATPPAHASHDDLERDDSQVPLAERSPDDEPEGPATANPIDPTRSTDGSV